MRGFLVELQNRPDGQTNNASSFYSSMPVTLATYHQRYAAAIGSTQFVSVCLKAMDCEGNIYEQALVTTSYVPPEPEPEPEPEPTPDEGEEGEG